MKKLFYRLFSKAERALMMKDLSALCRRRLILTLLITLPLVCGGVPAFVPVRFRYGITEILRCGAV